MDLFNTPLKQEQGNNWNSQFTELLIKKQIT